MSESRTPSSPTDAVPKHGGRRRRISPGTLVALLAGAYLGWWVVRSPAAAAALARGLLSPMGICLALWLALSFYWSLAAKGASAARSAESPASRSLHLVLVNGGFLLAFWPFAGWLEPRAPLLQFPRLLPDWPALAPIGVAVQAGSFLLAVWARHRLGRHWSAEVTVKVDHELVRSGPYRRIRHPIYTGAIGMYLGPAIVSGRLQGVLSLALVTIAYVRKIRQEERVLSGEFGQAYDDYRRKSWALVPGVF